MAISNRDRIGKMFELLAPALDPVAMAAGRRIEAAPEWLTMLADLRRELTTR